MSKDDEIKGFNYIKLPANLDLDKIKEKLENFDFGKGVIPIVPLENTQQKYNSFIAGKMEEHTTTCMDPECHLLKVVIEATETFGHNEMEDGR